MSIKRSPLWPKQFFLDVQLFLFLSDSTVIRRQGVPNQFYNTCGIKVSYGRHSRSHVKWLASLTRAALFSASATIRDS